MSRPCKPSSRRWRPMRRNAIYRALTAPCMTRGKCSWIRLGALDQAWPGFDPHLGLMALLVDLEILELKPESADLSFTRRRDSAADQRLQRLQELVADHDAHGWPSDDVLHEEILALRPSGRAA